MNPIQTLSYNRMSPVYKKLLHPLKPVGTIFRIGNKLDGRSYISMAQNAETAIRKIYLALMQGSYENKALQKAFNASPNSFLFEDLYHYYDDDDAIIIINSLAKYYGGESLSFLYNKEDFTTKFAKVNKFIDYNKRIIDLEAEKARLSEALKKASQNAENIDNTIIARIVKDPINMSTVLAHWIRLLAKHLNQNVNEFNAASEKYDMIKSLIEKHNADNQSIRTFEQELAKLSKKIDELTTVKNSSDVTQNVAKDTAKNIVKDKTITPIQTLNSLLAASPKNEKSEVDELSDDKRIQQFKTITKSKSPLGFAYYNGTLSWDKWLEEVTPTLQSYPQFLKELTQEIKKYQKNKPLAKEIMRLRLENHSLDDVVTILNELTPRQKAARLGNAKLGPFNKKNVSACCDNLQAAYPAIYLAYGFKARSKNKNGSYYEKRVVANLRKKNINIPINI